MGWRVLLRALVVFATALGLAAPASAYQFTIQANGMLSPAQTERIERAVSWQVNRQVAKSWPINPVSFVPAGGIPITLTTTAETQSVCGTHRWGCHAWNGSAASITLDGTQGFDQTAIVIDHEVVETEVDPQLGYYIDGQQVEVCDPTSVIYTGVDNVPLWGFVLPAYFTHAEGDRVFTPNARPLDLPLRPRQERRS